MKILHVITGLSAGGAETVLCRLLESLRPPAFEHVVAALGREGALSDRIRSAGARLIHLDMNPMYPNPLALFRLRRGVRGEHPDVIHGWMYHANIAATLAVWGGDIPVLWGIRQSLYDLKSEKPLTRVVIRLGVRLSRRPLRILYNSVTSARQHEDMGYRRDKTTVIPNGFDTEVFRPDPEARQRLRAELAIPDGTIVIGLIARLHPMKDHASFLRAAALLVQTHPQTIFVLVGEGTDTGDAALRAEIVVAGLSDHMRMCGSRSDVAAINAALDIASSSSSWGEAFPNAIGEAMACSVPCVATDVGDVRDIVGDTGIVVPPRDPEALAAGWRSLIEGERTLRMALGEKARQRIIERYGLAEISERYAGLYREVAKRGGD